MFDMDIVEQKKGNEVMEGYVVIMREETDKQGT